MGVLITYFRNLSVTWKFLLAYFAILIIPIVFMGVFLYNQTLNSAIAQAQMVMEQNLAQTKDSILHKVKVIQNMSQIIIFDNKMQTFLNNRFENEADNYENYLYNISPFVENILRQNRQIHSIRVYMANPTIPELSDSFYNIERIISKKWYKGFLNNYPGQNRWHNIHEEIVNIPKMSKTIPEPVFSYCSKIKSVNSNEVVGLLDIEIKENTFFDVLREPVTAKLGRVFMVDRAGMVVSNNYPEMFKENVNLFVLKNITNDLVLNEIQKVDGINSIIISIPIKEIDCSILGIFPVDNFTDKVKGSIPAIIFVLTGSSLLLGFIIFITTSALLSRIRRLVKAMRQVREGSLNISIPVKSKDEFGKLASSFNHMTGRIHDLVETVYKIQLMEQEAELKALEAQINPHFLYNTLSTVSWVARKAKFPEIVKITNSLAKFYRLVLSKGNTLILVQEELDIIKYYLEIQKIRFEGRFDVIYEINEHILNYKMVKNILQPIVENALSHGLEPKRGHGTIIIKAFECGKKLIFQVIDDGIGINNSTLHRVLEGDYQTPGNKGYALSNIKRRLKAYYGDQHTFNIYSKPGIGTVLTISVNKVLS